MYPFPVPVLHLQRTGSSQSIFLADPDTSFLIHFGWSYVLSSVPYHLDKMLSKSFIASIFLLASISAHTGVGPVLGVQGLLIPNDVQLRATDIRDFNG
jgi:hypothetical protein